MNFKFFGPLLQLLTYSRLILIRLIEGMHTILGVLHTALRDAFRKESQNNTPSLGQTTASCVRHNLHVIILKVLNCKS